MNVIKPQTAKELINWWLDHINENDPACRGEVLDACKADPEARKDYIEIAKKSWTNYAEEHILLYEF